MGLSAEAERAAERSHRKVGCAIREIESWHLFVKIWQHNSPLVENSSPPLAMAAKTKRYSHCCTILLLASSGCLHFQSPGKVAFQNGEQREMLWEELL